MIFYAQMALLGGQLSLVDASIIPLLDYVIILGLGFFIGVQHGRSRRLLFWLMFSFGWCLFPDIWSTLTLYVMSRMGLLDPELFLSQNQKVVQLSYGVITAVLLGITSYLLAAIVDIWRETQAPDADANDTLDASTKE